MLPSSDSLWDPRRRREPQVAGLTPFATLGEFRDPAIAGSMSSADRQVFARIFAWAEEFLCQPHAELGRGGVVCPYSRASLDTERFFVATCRAATGAVAELEARRALGVATDLWRAERANDPARALHLCTLVVFPEIAAEQEAAVIDTIHGELSIHFVEAGMMLGDFYPSSRAPGLHNLSFAPLASPMPLLAVRQMVLADLPFLVGSQAKVDAYLAHFGDAGRRVLERWLARGGRIGERPGARRRGSGLLAGEEAR